MTVEIAPKSQSADDEDDDDDNDDDDDARRSVALASFESVDVRLSVISSYRPLVKSFGYVSVFLGVLVRENSQ